MTVRRDLELEMLLAPLRRRIALMLTRGVVTLVDDARKMQELQVTGLGGEVHDKVERWQSYGFSSVPKAPDASGAAEAILAALGGGRDHLAAVGVDDRRYRPKGLLPGESVMYDDQGQTLKLARGGFELNATRLAITCGASSIVIDTNGVTITAPAIDLEEA